MKLGIWQLVARRSQVRRKSWCFCYLCSNLRNKTECDLLWAIYMDYLFDKYVDGSLANFSKLLFCISKYVAVLIQFYLEYKGNSAYCWNHWVSRYFDTNLFPCLYSRYWKLLIPVSPTGNLIRKCHCQNHLFLHSSLLLSCNSYRVFCDVNFHTPQVLNQCQNTAFLKKLQALRVPWKSWCSLNLQSP